MIRVFDSVGAVKAEFVRLNGVWTQRASTLSAGIAARDLMSFMSAAAMYDTTKTTTQQNTYVDTLNSTPVNNWDTLQTTPASDVQSGSHDTDASGGNDSLDAPYVFDVGYGGSEESVGRVEDVRSSAAFVYVAASDEYYEVDGDVEDMQWAAAEFAEDTAGLDWSLRAPRSTRFSADWSQVTRPMYQAGDCSALWNEFVEKIHVAEAIMVGGIGAAFIFGPEVLIPAGLLAAAANMDAQLAGWAWGLCILNEALGGGGENSRRPLVPSHSGH